MKNVCAFVAALLCCGLALLLWRSLFDFEGLPERLMKDMTTRPIPAPPLPGRVPYEADAPPMADATVLFAIHCAHCHGEDGSGRSYVAAQPGMPDVSDLRSNPAPAARKHQSLVEGRGAMPAFGRRLPAPALETLYQHILKLHVHPSP